MHKHEQLIEELCEVCSQPSSETNAIEILGLWKLYRKTLAEFYKLHGLPDPSLTALAKLHFAAIKIQGDDKPVTAELLIHAAERECLGMSSTFKANFNKDLNTIIQALCTHYSSQLCSSNPAGETTQ